MLCLGPTTACPMLHRAKYAEEAMVYTHEAATRCRDAQGLERENSPPFLSKLLRKPNLKCAECRVFRTPSSASEQRAADGQERFWLTFSLSSAAFNRRCIATAYRMADSCSNQVGGPSSTIPRPHLFTPSKLSGLNLHGAKKGGAKKGNEYRVFAFRYAPADR